MKRFFLLATVVLLVLSSCSFTKYEETGTLIVDSKEAVELIDEGYLLLDAQKKTSWLKEHAAGAANIERKQIMISDPVPNSVAPSSVIAEAAEMAGLTENSDIIIYDDNKNMDATRLYWTLTYYGHKGDIKILSGGLSALKERGMEIASGEESTAMGKYTASGADDSVIALIDELSQLIDNPDEQKVILDVRTDEEYFAGTIPGSIHINHEENLFSDGSFKPVQHIKILYKEAGILPDDEIIIYCKSSVRAANSYAALYNGGYRNLKIYDGAWLEWSKSGEAIYTPEREFTVITASQDNS
ncbi:MAG: rhodanese-like domain-containing protein [Spirochaetales bacterium]|nr:rhodanese-like domain-containing protein [Spirochaetales bacterium]